MKELIGFFIVSILASLIADFLCIFILAWGADEIAHLERKLSDRHRYF